MDKLSAMKAFVRVVESGTFTKAADSLGVPKAQITRLVQSLEQDLRTLLLNRTTRRVVTTADGAAYYERAARVLDDIEELESNMSTAKVQPRGKLRIDVSPPVANQIIIPSLEDFCAKYPDVQIDIGVGERPVDMVGESVDCAVRAGVVSDPSLVARRLGEVRRVFCASPAYLKRCGAPQHPTELEGEPHRVIRYFTYAGGPLSFTLERDGEQFELNPRSTIAVNDSSAMAAAGLAGLGIARSNLVVAAPYLESGRLRLVLPEWNAGSIPLSVVYPPNRHVSAKLRVFIDWIADLCSRSLPSPTSR
jgi:DNA-binding transcriptional LysR family regulator